MFTPESAPKDQESKHSLLMIEIALHGWELLLLFSISLFLIALIKASYTSMLCPFLS